MRVIKYNTPISSIDFTHPTVFLAGPTVRGNQPHLRSWRPEAVELFEGKGFRGNLILPEFPDSNESDQVRYDLPIWEYKGLSNSHVIMFWIPRTRELIGLTTNHEHGFWMGSDRNKVVYGRPNDAYRMSYLDIMWVEQAKEEYSTYTGDMLAIYTTLEKTVDAVLRHPRLKQLK